MTQDEFILLLKQPESVEAKHIPELKEMISYYPYFAEAKILLAKAMLKSDSLHSNHYVDNATLFVPDRRVLYFYLYPEKKLTSKPIPVNRIPKYDGTYFDMIKAMEAEGGDTKESFRNLAQKLKSAREMMAKEINIPKKNENPAPAVKTPIPEYFDLTKDNLSMESVFSEDYAKKLIKERKYEAAIEILKKLNLINPKKSIYFADQIRFLEKILVKTKK